jgi:membrane-associated phospholipid phosphatase
MFAFEMLALAYFAALTLAAVLEWRARGQRTPRFVLRSSAMVLLISVASLRAATDLRIWLGHAYLVFGYWLPALLAGPPTSHFESWLRRSDERWRRWIVAVPDWIRAFLEVSYFLCYPAVPGAFTVVWLRGSPHDIDRFWTAVLVAGFVCYGSLPWLVSRPPRSLALGAAPPEWIGRLNIALLNRVSHGLNTFPSGHVAVSVAAALMLLDVSLVAVVLFGLVAAAIAAGAVIGRYHYAIDVLIGAAVGVVSAVVALRFLPGPT